MNIEEPRFTPSEQQIADALMRLPYTDLPSAGVDGAILHAASAYLKMRQKRRWVRVSVAAVAAAVVAVAIPFLALQVPTNAVAAPLYSYDELLDNVIPAETELFGYENAPSANFDVDNLLADISR